MPKLITATRYHDFSCAHRAVGVLDKCGNIHGHNYRVHFECASITGDLSKDTGRAVDFSVINYVLCQWLESNWDHKLLLWDQDPLYLEYDAALTRVEPDPAQRAWIIGTGSEWLNVLIDSVESVPFNTSTENMADYLLVKGNDLLLPYGARLHSVRIDETRKCGVVAVSATILADQTAALLSDQT